MTDKAVQSTMAPLWGHLQKDASGQHLSLRKPFYFNGLDHYSAEATLGCAGAF
jgi:hypothetical protein